MIASYPTVKPKATWRLIRLLTPVSNSVLWWPLANRIFSSSALCCRWNSIKVSWLKIESNFFTREGGKVHNWFWVDGFRYSFLPTRLWAVMKWTVWILWLMQPFFQHFSLNSRPAKLKKSAKLKKFFLNSSKILP